MNQPKYNYSNMGICYCELLKETCKRLNDFDDNDIVQKSLIDRVSSDADNTINFLKEYQKQERSKTK